MYGDQRLVNVVHLTSHLHNIQCEHMLWSFPIGQGEEEYSSPTQKFVQPLCTWARYYLIRGWTILLRTTYLKLRAWSRDIETWRILATSYSSNRDIINFPHVTLETGSSRKVDRWAETHAAADYIFLSERRFPAPPLSAGLSQVDWGHARREPR